MRSVDLRPYQAQAVADLRSLYMQGTRRICIVSPTGSGKTVIAGHLIRSSIEKGLRVLYVAHRWELIDQPRKLLEACGLRVGLIKAGQTTDPAAPVQIASIQTLIRREFPPADLLIVDECHRAVAGSYKRLARYPVQLGLTATPWRLDGKGLGSLYESMVEVAKPSQLIADGWILEPRQYAPSQPETPRGGGADYTLPACARVMDRPELVGDVVEHWKRLAVGRPTVCFASGVKHSMHLMMRLADAGARTTHIDGKTPAGIRARALDGLARGEIDVVCNVDLITEGYDLPTLGCAILARPTMSLTKYLQMTGRIVRPHATTNGPKPRPIILDHAGCSHRFGHSSDDRTWSLDGREDRRARSGARVCSYCFCVCPAGSVKCQECGEKFPVEERPRKTKKERDGVLVEVRRAKRAAASARNKVRRGRDTIEQKRAAYLQLKMTAQHLGRKPGWAWHVYRGRYGEDPG